MFYGVYGWLTAVWLKHAANPYFLIEDVRFGIKAHFGLDCKRKIIQMEGLDVNFHFKRVEAHEMGIFGEIGDDLTHWILSILHSKVNFIHKYMLHTIIRLTYMMY